MSAYLTDEEVRERILLRIAKMGSSAAWSRHLGISESYVSQVVNESRLPSRRMLADVGVERVTVYRRTMS